MPFKTKLKVEKNLLKKAGYLEIILSDCTEIISNRGVSEIKSMNDCQYFVKKVKYPEPEYFKNDKKSEEAKKLVEATKKELENNFETDKLYKIESQ